MTGEPIGRSVKSMHDPDVSFSGSGSPEDYYGVPIAVSLFSSQIRNLGISIQNF